MLTVASQRAKRWELLAKLDPDTSERLASRRVCWGDVKRARRSVASCKQEMSHTFPCLGLSHADHSIVEHEVFNYTKLNVNKWSFIWALVHVTTSG